jgi:hypothetical protein
MKAFLVGRPRVNGCKELIDVMKLLHSVNMTHIPTQKNQIMHQIMHIYILYI